MDQNQIPPMQAPSPVGPVPPAVPPEDKTQGPNKLLMILVFILFVVLIGLSFYFVTQVMLPKTSNDSVDAYPTPITQITPSATPTPSLETDEDVEAIEIGSPEGDLVEINTDLNSL